MKMKTGIRMAKRRSNGYINWNLFRLLNEVVTVQFTVELVGASRALLLGITLP
ncbi:MAG: hypothetical protein WD059_15905 [Balneolaceae bacterium]